MKFDYGHLEIREMLLVRVVSIRRSPYGFWIVEPRHTPRPQLPYGPQPRPPLVDYERMYALAK